MRAAERSGLELARATILVSQRHLSEMSPEIQFIVSLGGARRPNIRKHEKINCSLMVLDENVNFTKPLAHLPPPSVPLPGHPLRAKKTIKNNTFGSLGLQVAPRCPKIPQDAAKMAPRCPQDAPRWPKMPPRWPKIAPRWPQDG